MLEEELAITEKSKQAFFVDFLRDAPEPTGDEPEDADLDAPKVYEEVPSLDRHYQHVVHGLHLNTCRSLHSMFLLRS